MGDFSLVGFNDLSPFILWHCWWVTFGPQKLLPLLPKGADPEQLEKKEGREPANLGSSGKWPPPSLNQRSLEGKRENYQVCNVQYCVQQLCTVQCTHTHAHMNIPNSCSLVRFRFTVVILFATVYLCQVQLFGFISARCSCASAVLGAVILSVRLSVHLSHVCFVTNPKNLPAIFLYHMKGQSFCHPTVVGGRRPLPPKMGNRSDPPPFQVPTHTFSIRLASQRPSCSRQPKMFNYR